MAHPEGFEPPTAWFEAKDSIQLSYGCSQINNTIKSINCQQFFTKILN